MSKKRHAFDVDYENAPDSKPITDPVILMKMQAAADFIEAALKHETKDVLEMTGLDKSDYSRLKVGNIERFTLDRLIVLLNNIGCDAELKVRHRKTAS